ncbi:MAG TPA: hypothetical protein VII75_10345 [Thermoanaerobaculia bacterium]|nr:hypothetical protein [Thermoanaerobaculia bacterium]
MSRTERFFAAALALLLLGVRAACFFRYRFDSDEPQHLHVAWGWTQGLIQYRDLFDNHAPLFHIVTAPFLALFGERADILFYMRALMLPIWIFVCVATFLIARRFYPERVAIWSLLLLNLFPTFFLKSIEYRTDNLWVAVWMAAFLAFSSGAFFVAGLLLGISACVSLKTSLLAITLLLACVPRWREWRRVLPAIGGFAIAPAILALVFVKLGAWPDLVYCNFTFNELVAATRPHHVWPRVLYLPILIAIFYFVRDHFILRMSLIYTATLGCWWILISPRDFLAILPFFAMLVAAWIDTIRLRIPALAALTLLCIVGIGHDTDWLKNDTPEFITMMNQVLHLTKPGEPLMDYKGETIYRRRPYYFIFEAIGRAQLKNRMIPDTIARDMIAARCYVAQADGAFWPPDAKAWLLHHYIDLGRLRAAGGVLEEDGRFDVAIAGSYVLIDKNGEAAGMLDGVPYHGAVQLTAGAHHFARSTNERVAWLWAPAFERGYSPFHLRDLDF